MIDIVSSPIGRRLATAKIATVLLLALPVVPGAGSAEEEQNPAANKAAANDAKYAAAFKKFSETPQIAAMLAESCGYALFPTIGKGGILIGAAFGNGRVNDGAN